MTDKIRVAVSRWGPDRPLALYYTDPVSGRRVARSARTDKPREAERAAAVLEDELNSGRYQVDSKITWEHFRERYEYDHLAGLAEKSKKVASASFNALERICRPGRLADVTAARLAGFASKLRDEQKSEATIACYLRHVRASLGWAVDMDLLPTAPKIKMPKRARGSKVMKGRPITLEEFERMLAKVPEVRPDDAPVWDHYLRGLWWSGLRLGESLELYWQERPGKLSVDLEGRHPMLRIPAEAEKGGRDRLLAVAPEFAGFLLETPEADRRGRVFRVPGVADTVGKVIARIGKLAVVKVDASGRGKVKYASAHDLRRSFGSRWAPRVMPQTLMELMRHEKIETTLRYYVGRNAEATADVLWAAYRTANSSANIGPKNPLFLED